MIVYFATRQLEIKGLASTQLDGGYRIISDKLTEDIDSGVNSLELTVLVNDGDRAELESMAKVGSFILSAGGRAFQNQENQYNSLFQIVETEYNTLTRSLTIYAEDAGLELLGTNCGAIELKNKTLEQMLRATVPSDWTINLIGTPTGTRSNTWDGNSTAIERIDSIVGLFDCEVYYSFMIERLKVSEKIINVVNKRGNQEPIAQLRIGQHINSIVIKNSITSLVTALDVSGGNSEGADEPITLKNYDYSYTDPDTGDVYQVDKPTGQMRNISAMNRWSSMLDTDGLIVGSYSFDSTDKAVIAGQARAELQKLSKHTVEYNIDFAYLPEGIEIGDKVNIIDEEGAVYLEARILHLESSSVTETHTATLGEYVLKDSGISENISIIATRIANTLRSMLTLEIESSNGAVFIDTTVATTLTARVYRAGVELLDDEIATIGTIKWYNYDDLNTVLGTGKTYTILESSAINAINVVARLEEG